MLGKLSAKSCRQMGTCLLGGRACPVTGGGNGKDDVRGERCERKWRPSVQVSTAKADLSLNVCSSPGPLTQLLSE